MAQGEPQVTVVGNIVADPELRLTNNGAAVANFRVASTPRRFNGQTGQWEDGESLFLTCNVWKQVAQNVAESLTKGMRVIVTGRLKQRNFQTREGENRSVIELDVDEVGPSLRYATAQVMRNPQQSSGSWQGQNMAQQPAGAPSNNGWGNQPQQPANNGWGQAAQPPQQQPQQASYQPPAEGGFGQQQTFPAQDEEPPF